MTNLQEDQEYKESLQNDKILPNSDNIKIKIFFLLLKSLAFLFPKGNVQRFEKSLKFYLGLINIDDCNPQQKPTLFLYLGLPSKPWYEPDDYDVFKIVANTLEESAKEIKSELLINIPNKNDFLIPVIDPSSDRSTYEQFTDIELPASHKKDDWLLFRLWLNGKFTQEARYLFPKTVNILSKLKSFIDPFEDVYFLVLKPGVVLPPHHDTSNAYITCQLGLIIPENCGIRVGSETRSWTEGKTLFFDQSFEHEAWNKSQKERVVLLVHLRHPQLSKLENFLYEFFYKAL
ncbi:aspartyl/asparaginyl beta-hydroxylase domain-containing protein [Nostoc sp. CHAB 5784]|uniref:aspartyl/asparaginyl beta-hydroxylase domain-containing protein n=1 Tax=Nostoc mirabile TaxID=2907820 RepID=UPI001E32106C|nr:aspartyl/asparaginyl beta-hydroxylase domain-containing protein [Nostoc mirabile]MCC5666158.1 aspartyl/asparaginyl beta-hydroxylase domain-containing protein [Nostoc mirabile CHAB5784]